MGNCIDNKKKKNYQKDGSDAEEVGSTKNDKQKEIKNVDEWVKDLDYVQQNKMRITKEYNVLSPPLGRGAFGEVRKAIHKSTSIVRAVKIIFKDNSTPQELKRITNEVDMLKKLDHPNIIKVYEFFVDAKHFYIVTELCSGGELFDRIIKDHHFSEKKAAETMRQVLSAIVYCHDKNIVHRDQKPENILYESTKENSYLKVIDFGTSREFDPHRKMAQRLGTPYYIAPEVLEKRYTEKCDVWSCGVILYILLSGSPPFNGKDDIEIMDKVVKGFFNINIPELETVTLEAKDLMRKMMTYSQEKRISSQEAYNDPWFDKVIGSNIGQIDPQFLVNQKKFNTKSKLQQAVYYFIVNNMATREEKNDLIKCFKALDTNGDGKLSKEELINGYEKGGFYCDSEGIEALINNLDSNKSGAIDYTEFVAASIDKKKLLSEQRIESCFKLFDKDNSESISKAELKMMFGGNQKVDEGVWADLIKEVDINGDGEIDMIEFKEMLQKFA